MSIVARFPLPNVSKGPVPDGPQCPRGRRRLAGGRLHAVFGDEDNVRVSEVWESREKMEAFGEKLGPRLEEAGIQLSGEPEIFEAHIVDTY